MRVYGVLDFGEFCRWGFKSYLTFSLPSSSFFRIPKIVSNGLLLFSVSEYPEAVCKTLYDPVAGV